MKFLFVDRSGNAVDNSQFEFTLKDKQWVSDEESAAGAECPYLIHHIERNDGCGAQYQGKQHAGRVGLPLLVLRSYAGIAANR